MDARRALGILIGAAGTVLVVLGFAAAPGLLGWGGTYVIFVSGILGSATRGYLDHRRSGLGPGLRWALAYGGLMLLLFVAFVATAVAIRPIVSPNPMLGVAWPGILATGSVLGAISSLVWEPNPRRRRFAAVTFLALGLILGGLIASREGGWWTPLGMLSVPVGVIALLVGIVQGIVEGDRERAERAACSP